MDIERIGEEDNRLLAVAFLNAIIEEMDGDNNAEQHLEKESLLDQ